MMSDAYRAALDSLYARLNYERAGMPLRGTGELRLARTRRLLRRLGDPQDALKIVHVAGTKGKGSTCALIAAGLKGAGLRVGLTTSPHLHRLEERFVIDGEPITEAELVDLLDTVRPAVEACDRDEPHPEDRLLTFFEVTTAMALVLFARREVDVAVLEVGMGGRLDSTNAVRPLVSVITSISFDHVRQLGPTLHHIATEKAGIIKRAGRVVSGVLNPEPREAIRSVARARRALLHELEGDIDWAYHPPAPPLRRPANGEGRTTTWRTDWGWFDLPLPGEHQARNLAVALAALDALADADPSLAVSPRQAAAGIAPLKWPARVEILGDRPWLVIDGAHNVASAEALAQTLQAHFPAVPRTLVFGTSKDKDLEGQLRALLPLFDRVVATRFVENPRAVPPIEIADTVARLFPLARTTAPHPAAALDEARRLTPADGLICVTGSLFLAGEARAVLLGLEPVYNPGPPIR